MRSYIDKGKLYNKIEKLEKEAIDKTGEISQTIVDHPFDEVGRRASDEYIKWTAIAKERAGTKKLVNNAPEESVKRCEESRWQSAGKNANNEDLYACKNCGFTDAYLKFYKYCPGCGAKMTNFKD